MTDLSRSDGGEVVIRVEGTFDGNAAVRLARHLCEVPPAAPLVIDFSRVEQFHDVGVAAVAKELAGHSGVALRGLGRHQLRLLRYCGVELPAGRREADEEARDLE